LPHIDFTLTTTRFCFWNLGDLLAEGAIDIDNLSAQAIRDEEIQERRRKATEATAYLDDPDWEPPYVIEGSDF
jgi:hypothetical protein